MGMMAYGLWPSGGARMARVSYAYHTCIRVWVCMRMSYVYTRGRVCVCGRMAYGYVRMGDGLAAGGVCRMGMFDVSPVGGSRSPRDAPNMDPPRRIPSTYRYDTVSHGIIPILFLLGGRLAGSGFHLAVP